MHHLMHGGDQGHTVRFTLRTFFLKEVMEEIGMHNGHRSRIVKAGAENFITSLGDVALTVNAGAALMNSGIKADESGELF